MDEMGFISPFDTAVIGVTVTISPTYDGQIQLTLDCYSELSCSGKIL